jgi:DNA-binding NtrC family response regulator
LTDDESSIDAPSCGGVLLIAADWQSRALALAELQEAGYDVTALPGLRHALAALAAPARRAAWPALIILDVRAGEDAAPGRVEDLVALAAGVPLILVVGAFDRAAWEPLRARVAALLVRPVTVGALVDTVRRVLAADQAGATA